ncbi:MAG: DUF503 domain-containing protein [Candidatus Hydrogenedentes bacterium]|nr:DUF503 domain-containing protein [Candidatus Hydrogenedentota bacterium]
MATLIGLLQIELAIPGNRSLKDKRRVIASIKGRIRSKFNVSVAEVDLNDVWDAALLAVTCVANESAVIHQMLSKVVDTIESHHEVAIVDYVIEIL